MSFASPLMLLALAALPAVAAVYARLRKRPGRYSARFPGVPVLAGVVAASPRWRRHLPAAVGALALAALAIALARPHATVAVPVERASVVLVTDVSRSMLATDVEPSRLEAARGAAESFLDGVPDELRVGAVTFSTTPLSTTSPSHDREAVRSQLADLRADGGTATGDGLTAALRLLERGDDRRPPAAVVLLSDGETTRGRDPVDVAREARAQRVPIHTVALGTSAAMIPDGSGGSLPVPPDPETMAEIAAASGGDSFDVDDAGELDSIYERLGSQIGTRPEEREITAGFAAGGMALMLAACALGLRAGGRLP
jgi:Ca-activated chloride channel homolog